MTNNPLVWEKLHTTREMIYKETTFEGLLVELRDRIHQGHMLLTHPLSGSVKPNEKMCIRDRYTGFDLELAQEVCDRLDLKFEPKPIAWDSKDAELSSGGIDCIWNGFTMNGREDEYTWSDAYLDNKQVFVVRDDSGIDSEKDLEGKVVDVQTDSSAQAALDDNQELAATFGNLEVVPDYNTGFMNLESGAVDAVAMDIDVYKRQVLC